METGHFLVYHLLPPILIIAALHCIVILLMYFHKKSNQKTGVKKPEKLQISWNPNSTKRRDKK